MTRGKGFGAGAVAAIALATTVASAQPVVPLPRRSPLAPIPPAPVAAPAPTAAPPAPTPAVPVPAKRAAPKAPARPKDTSAPRPAPDVKLTLDVPSRLGPWTMRVTNTGSIPLRLVADARLLVLEVLPRSADKPVRCELPPDMRPGDDADGALVLPPGRSYAERFEPRLYCFGGKQLDALAPGAVVVAHLGWMGGSATRGPFAVQSIEGIEPELAPLKALESLPVALPDDPSPSFSVLTTVPADDPDPARLALKGATSIDATSPANVTLGVSLRNEGKRPVTLRFRPETLRFEVASRAGVDDCHWPVNPGAPTRELFTTLRSGATTDLAIVLGEFCDTRIFERPGLLVVRPELDTRRASGADLAIRTFDGRVIATTPTLIRLHQGIKPPRLPRPRLEPEAP